MDEKEMVLVKDIAKAYSMKEAFVRSLCHAKGQRFAFKFKEKNGKIFIDPKGFKKHVKKYWIDYLRKI